MRVIGAAWCCDAHVFRKTTPNAFTNATIARCESQERMLVPVGNHARSLNTPIKGHARKLRSVGCSCVVHVSQTQADGWPLPIMYHVSDLANTHSHETARAPSRRSRTNVACCAAPQTQTRAPAQSQCRLHHCVHRAPPVAPPNRSSTDSGAQPRRRAGERKNAQGGRQTSRRAAATAITTPRALTQILSQTLCVAQNHCGRRGTRPGRRMRGVDAWTARDPCRGDDSKRDRTAAEVPHGKLGIAD